VLFSEPKIPQYDPPQTRNPVRQVSVLFSEPKIPQCPRPFLNPPNPPKFQCSSASRKFLNKRGYHPAAHSEVVSVLFSEPKIPQFSALARSSNRTLDVSVLFSEPKIPQYIRGEGMIPPATASFSALQRAENSSIVALDIQQTPAYAFQCSSASRKFLNPSQHRIFFYLYAGFSALQRAENSSIEPKFEQRIFRPHCFSALQRAENSSIRAARDTQPRSLSVSVLFSEPKIPQFGFPPSRSRSNQSVSVLFSEPKIPQ